MDSSQPEASGATAGAAGGAGRKGGERRKRGHSQGGGSRTGGSHISLKDTVKRLKTADNSQAEKCVLCGECVGQEAMVQCECCDQHWHLKCCGIAAAYHEIGVAMLLLIGFNCRECRVNRVSRQSAIEAGINDLNDRINKLTASIKPGTNATNTSTMAVESNGAGSTGRQKGAGGGQWNRRSGAAGGIGGSKQRGAAGRCSGR